MDDPIAPKSEPPATTAVALRSPSSHTVKTATTPPKGSDDVNAMSYDWMKGTWHVSYSTLPLWKGKQNVRITYKALVGEETSVSGRMPNLDDHVEYQKAGSNEWSSVRGVSKPAAVEGVGHGLAYAWRGKGLLAVASSSWEILAYGTDIHAAEHNDYAVTYFGKTLFTPAGLDIYTRTTSHLSEETLSAIKGALQSQSDQNLASLAKSIFEIPRVSDSTDSKA